MPRETKKTPRARIRKPDPARLEKLLDAGASRRSGAQPPRRKQTIYLSPEVRKRLKLHAATEERELSAIVEDALRAFLPA